jgi:hypothetical protein
MAYGAKSIADTATLILDPNTARKGFIICNNSSSVVYLGPDSSVTTVNGLPLFEYQQLTKDKIPEGWLGPIYAIVASGTADVRYWENS